jgi:hypothetical protein
MTRSAASRSSTSDPSHADKPDSPAPRLSEPTRRRARTGLGAIGAVLAASALAASASAAATPPSVTETFPSTGAEQPFTVPAGVTSVRVRAIGAAGEEGRSFDAFFSADAPGGDGAAVVGQLPVTPGEVLYVEVAQNSSGGGGFAPEGGGAGGGASDVRTVPEASAGTLESRLLVAAGGGGGGGTFEEGSGGAGGNAGSPGVNGVGGEGGGPEGNRSSAAGGAGTLSGGGLGGARCEVPSPWMGLDGQLGSGGNGGLAGASPESGGGGGGGGYWGGGGGEGSCEFAGPFGDGGAGGGGGSSYIEEDASSASLGLVSPSTAPSVTISYATPATATPSTSTVSFSGTQPLDTVSAPQTIEITNEGGNPLALSSEAFGGSNPVLVSDHPEDFLIGSSSCLSAIAFEESCELTVRFDPQETGTSTATLQLTGNIGAGPTTIELSGTGGTLPQGATGAQGSQGTTGAQGAKGEAGAAGQAGTTGTQGPAGETGKTGTTGPQGPTGPEGQKGERGPRGLTATYVCHPRQRNGKYKEACFVSVTVPPGAAATARVERHGVTYASASVGRTTSASPLLLKAERKVPAGRYTLVLAGKHGTSLETVTIG